MIINNGPIGSVKFNPLKDLLIKYGTQTEYSNITTSGVENIYKFGQDTTGKKWEVAFLTSCQVQLRKNLKKCDIFLVGGGNPGGDGNKKANDGDSRIFKGGNGGRGGGLLTQFNISFLKNNYNFIIGQSNEATKINEIYVAQPGEGSYGGKGAYAIDYLDGNGPVEINGSTTNLSGNYLADGKKAFNDMGSIIYSDYKFGAGGGGGGKRIGTADGGSPGGASGGGSGSDGWGESLGNPGTANSGGGGGGGSAAGSGTDGTAGGAGGSGIIIIRGNL